MQQAGFEDVCQMGTTPVKTSEFTIGAGFYGKKPLAAPVFSVD
jgi:hypothetical protein